MRKFKRTGRRYAKRYRRYTKRYAGINLRNKSGISAIARLPTVSTKSIAILRES